MLSETKKALQITTTQFDDDVLRLIKAGVKDLRTSIGCQFLSEESANDVTINDPLIAQAIITYVRCNFGSPDNYDKLKASYNEQKGQLRENSEYSGDIYG